MRARWGAFAMDTMLVAYAGGTIHLWTDLRQPGSGFLHAMPHLLWLAPVIAAAWQATKARSLGQRAYAVAVTQGEASASADGRWTWALGVALQAVAVGLPALWVGAWGWSLALGAGVCGLGLWLGRSLPERLAGVTVARVRPEETVASRAWWGRLNPWASLVLLGLTAAVCVKLTRFDLGALTRVENAKSMVGHMLDPDWSIAGRVALKMVETIALALTASALAVPFAFGLSFLGARNLMTDTIPGRIVYTVTRLVMNVMRSIEPLVWAIVFSLWVGVGPFAGMLALFVHSVAALGKLYSESIESIDEGPVEAMKATGARAPQVLRYGVVPQVIPPFLSFTVYRWDINVRMATILGLVGGGGIGELLINYTQIGAWSKVGTILLFITFVVWIMDLGSSKARARLT